MFLGNLFVYYQFQGKTHIDLGTRQLVFGVLIGVAVIGIIFLATLRQSGQKEHNSIENIDKEDTSESEEDGITDAFKKAIKLFFTPRMLLLSLTFIYTGMLNETVEANHFLTSIYCQDLSYHFSVVYTVHPLDLHYLWVNHQNNWWDCREYALVLVKCLEEFYLDY